MAGMFSFGKSRPFRKIAWSTYNVNRIITWANIATKRCLWIFVRAFRKLLQVNVSWMRNEMNSSHFMQHIKINIRSAFIYLPNIAKNYQWYEQRKQWYTEWKLNRKCKFSFKKKVSFQIVFGNEYRTDMVGIFHIPFILITKRDDDNGTRIVQRSCKAF